MNIHYVIFQIDLGEWMFAFKSMYLWLITFIATDYNEVTFTNGFIHCNQKIIP